MTRGAKVAGLVVGGVLVVVVGGVFLVRAAFLGQSLGTNPAAREADRHAETAGIAMLKHNVDEPAASAAARVVGGHLPGDTIEALVLSGTTRHGEILLRITVEQEAGGYSAPAEGDALLPLRPAAHPGRLHRALGVLPAPGRPGRPVRAELTGRRYLSR